MFYLISNHGIKDMSSYDVPCNAAEVMRVIREQQKDINVTEMFNTFFGRLKNNQCPHCGKTIEKQNKILSCVYLKPCGCRLWQGELFHQSTK